MIIDCISDLHGFQPELEGGDLLIVAGDLTGRDEVSEYHSFIDWIGQQKYEKKVLIAGNHDNLLSAHSVALKNSVLQYLCDSGTEFHYYPALQKGMPDGTTYVRKKFKIWGSPWTLWFEGINPLCTAFTVKTEAELAEKWALIPDDIDILVTHSPPFGILDEVHRYSSKRRCAEHAHVGSISLEHELKRIKPKLHVFGHIHEGYGMYRPKLEWPSAPTEKLKTVEGYPIFVNAAIMNRVYDPVNKPIRIVL